MKRARQDERCKALGEEKWQGKQSKMKDVGIRRRKMARKAKQDERCKALGEEKWQGKQSKMKTSRH